MRVQFLGATRTTSGSFYLFEFNGQKLLLDCGLVQGRRGESIERNRNFSFDPKRIDAVILSHAHIDHCGNLPNLCRQGFEGNIYCTFAPRDLASIMLEDSAKMQRDDAAFVSKKRAKHALPPVEPLYTAADADRAARQFVGINYDRPFPVTDGVTVTFRDAGHILGAAEPGEYLFGEPHEVRARIASLDSFSGHADENELRRSVEPSPATSGRSAWSMERKHRRLRSPRSCGR